MEATKTRPPEWVIICEPQGRDLNNPQNEKNDGGLVVFLQRPALYIDGKQWVEMKVEVNRVAFERKDSKNPRVTFKAQIDKEIAKAVHACKLLNGDLMGDGELQ